MEKRLFDVDPFTGITEYFYYDPDADKVTIQQVQDTTHIVEQNKALFNATDERAKWGEWSKVASIPISVWADLNAKGIVRDKVAFKKWLNSPDNRYFRTRPGQV
jgi:hypothetical protein